MRRVPWALASFGRRRLCDAGWRDGQDHQHGADDSECCPVHGVEPFPDERYGEECRDRRLGQGDGGRGAGGLDASGGARGDRSLAGRGSVCGGGLQ